MSSPLPSRIPTALCAVPQALLSEKVLVITHWGKQTLALVLWQPSHKFQLLGPPAQACCQGEAPLKSHRWSKPETCVHRQEPMVEYATSGPKGERRQDGHMVTNHLLIKKESSFTEKLVDQADVTGMDRHGVPPRAMP